MIAGGKKAIKEGLAVDWETLLAGISTGKTVVECGENHTIFTQGQRADSVCFLLRGKVKLAVATQEGKEAIVATLSAGQFLDRKSVV